MTARAKPAPRAAHAPRSAALRRAVAASVDAPPALLPVLPRLFAGLDSLGSTPRTVVSMLRRHGARPSWRVLDLACGKGAAAIAIARNLRCRVTAVDAFEPFIEHAKLLAARRAVTSRCTFTTADVLTWRSKSRFDAALMLGLFGVERAAPLLRRHLRPGGVYIIDDAFLDSTHPRCGSFPGVPTLDESRALVERRGDNILEEIIPTRLEISKLNASLYRRIALNARAIRRAEPALAPALDEFLDRQRKANRTLQGPLRGALWLIRRAT